jgi:hypothetical protein
MTEEQEHPFSVSVLQNLSQTGEYNNVRIFLYKVFNEEKFNAGDFYHCEYLKGVTGVRQRNTVLNYKGEPGQYLVWVEVDHYGDVNADNSEIPFTLGFHGKQEDNPVTIELIPEELFSHETVR